MVASVPALQPLVLPLAAGVATPPSDLDPDAFAGVMQAASEGLEAALSGAELVPAPAEEASPVAASPLLGMMASLPVVTAPAVSAPLVSPPLVLTIAAPGVVEEGVLSLPKPPSDTQVSVEVFTLEEASPEAVAFGKAPVAEELPTELMDRGGESDSELPDESSATESSGPEPITTGATGEARPLRIEASVRTEGGRHEVRLDTHNVVRELANRIELMAAARQEQGVIVHLEPQDLGSITLLVKPDSGGVTAEIGATNDQVRQALAQSQTALTKQLELRGVVVAQVSVSAETSNHNPQRQSDSQYRPPNSFAEGRLGDSRSGSALYSEQQGSRRSLRVRSNGVDLWI